MSETFVVESAVQIARRMLGRRAADDVTATLEALDPRFPCFLAALGGALGLNPPELRSRCVAVCLVFAATQLADDLSDGDCDYLQDPSRTGPGTQWLIHHLAAKALLQTTCAAVDIDRSYSDLLAVGSSQQFEVRVRPASYEEARELAEGLNGRQFSAYFRLLASGTRWAEEAANWGSRFGAVLHVVGDRVSRDPRFRLLTAGDQRALLGWARAQLADLRENPLVIIRRTAVWFSAVLDLPVDAEVDGSRETALVG